MSTEYRRGIPSVAHVEAATRLGLLWRANEGSRWTSPMLATHAQFPASAPTGLLGFSFRPIRTDGTPVDWAVLDAEVARVAQPATVTPTASIVPTTQPQGFRADLWRRICDAFFPHAADAELTANDFNRVTGLDATHLHMRASGAWSWANAARSDGRTDILTRWAVYQELKPLYDIVDGAQGEVTMPRDVELAWAYCVAPSAPFAEGWFLFRDESGLRARLSWGLSWRPEEDGYGVPLRNFAAVLDAVAEQRVAARQGRAAQPNTVTAMQTQYTQLDVETTLGVLRAQTATTAPEPRSFADVRPDRHGWRWWRLAGRNSTDMGERFEISEDRLCRWHRARSWFTAEGHSLQRNTVIPTDEQGNPVSWETIGQGLGAAQVGRDVMQPRFVPPPTGTAQPPPSVENPALWRAAPALWRAAQDMAVASTRSADEIYRSLLRLAQPTATATFQQLQEFTSRAITQVVMGQPHTVETDGDATYVSLKQQPLPRFTADELDDVDHSATTTQDSATLKRGKLPTVEAIGKYREVMAKRNGTVAEAVKASGIDCEVAQYVLERWAGGLSDGEALFLVKATAWSGFAKSKAPHYEVDSLAQRSLRMQQHPTLDTSEPADTAAQRQRAEAAERKARMTALQAQLAKERAARVAEPTEELSRFALLEVDEAADPVRSIEAWKVQRARNIVRPAAVPASQPTPAPRRKAFEVVDAQAEGLSGTAALAVLLGRAMNGGC